MFGDANNLEKFKRKLLDLVVRNLSHYIFSQIISYMYYAEIGIHSKFLVTTEIEMEYRISLMLMGVLT